VRESPRRRRRDEESSGGGLPIFPLVLVVVLAGLLLGGVLAHFFGGSGGAAKPPPATVAVTVTPLPTATPVPVPASPSPAVTPTKLRSPTPAPSVTPTVQPTPTLQPTPKSQATPARVAALRVQPSATGASPTPSPVRAAVTHKPIVVAKSPVTPPAALAGAPAPASTRAAIGDDRAASVVRSYLEALTRGDRPAAAAYLSHGVPSETFVNSGSHIQSIRSASVGADHYKVTADIQTASGEYYVTFTLEPGPAGLEITDHYAIKTQ
jgi:hypothetical protein